MGRMRWWTNHLAITGVDRRFSSAVLLRTAHGWEAPHEDAPDDPARAGSKHRRHAMNTALKSVLCKIPGYPTVRAVRAVRDRLRGERHEVPPSEPPLPSRWAQLTRRVIWRSTWESLGGTPSNRWLRRFAACRVR